MKRILNSLIGLAAYGIAAIAQTMPPVVIEISAPNCVNYVIDTADVSKYGWNRGDSHYGDTAPVQQFHSHL